MARRRGEDRIDLRQVEAAAEQVGRALRPLDRYHVVAVKSTVVPGTTETVVGPALERGSGRRIGPDLGLGMNPEFLREGAAVRDFLHPDRIVLGGVDTSSVTALEAVYAVFEEVPVVRVEPRTAEMIKYTSNALLALLISFSNEVGNLAAELGCDVPEVLDGLHLDHRLSPTVDGERVRPGILSYLEAGCGFGGSCFPKDVRALLAHGESLGVPMLLLGSAMQVNDAQTSLLVQRLRRHIDPAGARVAVLGAAFKPGTDDVRESPALRVIADLLAAGAEVVLHDPLALCNAHEVLGDEGVVYEDDLGAALVACDAALLVTAWPEYAQVPALLAGHEVPVVDGRRMLDPSSVRIYDGVGYPTDA